MKLETRIFRLTVLSPVHIGCGDVYEPTSFVVKQDKRRLVGFDPLAFLETLSEEKLRKFSSICKQGTVESLLDVYKFINLEGQDVEGVEVRVGSEFLRHYKSVLNMDRKRVQQSLNAFLINRTAYNPTDGQVYLPGSAIKGSLRTAILNKRYEQKPIPGKFTWKGGSRELQEKILDGGKFDTDPFSRVKVSDFRPVNMVSRRIVYGVDEKKKQGKKDASAVYQVFEVIEPGAIFEGSLTIQEVGRGAKIPTPVTFAEIEEALTDFYGKECRREASEAAAIGATHDIKASEGSMLIRLGRHSGAECVTIADKRNIKIMTGRGNPSKTLDHATTIWFASEQRKPKVKGGLMPFGWAALRGASSEEIREGLAFDQRERERQAKKRETQLKRRQELARRQAEIKAQQQRLAEERAKAEAEARKYPWKPWIKKLEEVKDWGRFRQFVLDNEQAASWREEEGVAVAVAEAARRIRELRPEKWSADRDKWTAEWLESTGVSWDISAQKSGGDDVVAESLSPMVIAIKAYKEWGDFKQSPVKYTDLDKEAAQALLRRFKEWGCNGKRVKKDKKTAWKSLQIRLRELS